MQVKHGKKFALMIVENQIFKNATRHELIKENDS